MESKKKTPPEAGGVEGRRGTALLNQPFVSGAGFLCFCFLLLLGFVWSPAGACAVEAAGAVGAGEAAFWSAAKPTPASEVNASAMPRASSFRVFMTILSR
jgi:hypothetical protein